MKRDFHAIDAVAFSLGYGFRGLVTALRLGWPSLLLTLFGGYVLMLNGVDYDTSGMAGVAAQFSGAFVDDVMAFVARFVPGFADLSVNFDESQLAANAKEVTLPIGWGLASLVLANLLFMPAIVAM
ncbi:MAG: hypothetical protein V2I43_16570, partial [Parvularcula sp.]|nr:hypothetical protein [Parvularcula sp.]